MNLGAISSWLRGRDPRVVDGLFGLVLAAALMLQLLLHDAEGDAAVNVIGGLLLTLPLAWRRQAPLAVLAVFGAAAIANEALGGALFTFPESGAPEQDPPLFASLIAGITVFYSVGAHAPDRPAVAGLLLGIAALWATVLASDQVEISSFLWSGGLVALTPWLAGRATRGREQRLTAAAREQEQRTQLAVSEERARIARELHDVVAHNVGMILVQAEGGRRMLDRDPERAREALGSIEETARTALVEMRRSLGVLRGDGDGAALEPQPSIDNLEALLERARAGGLTIHLDVEGEPRPLARGVDLSAYRIIQEALTNTTKHAGPVATRIMLRYGESELEIEILDDGPGPPPGAAMAGSGHGILGMRERAGSHGGRLETGRGPQGGFLVRASLPLER